MPNSQRKRACPRQIEAAKTASTEADPATAETEPNAGEAGADPTPDEADGASSKDVGSADTRAADNCLALRPGSSHPNRQGDRQGDAARKMI